MNAEAVDHAIRVLNEALEADPLAVRRMMECSVIVNRTLAEHPTIQVGLTVPESEEYFSMRPLGLINGLFGADEDSWGFIAMELDAEGGIVRFLRTPPRQKETKP